MEFFISITAIILSFSIGAYFINKGIDEDSFGKQLLGFLLAVSSIIIGAVVYFLLEGCSNSKPNIPQAIDVYRGKTTLQITYQDSIPVDSVVVFKENVINDN